MTNVDAHGLAVLFQLHDCLSELTKEGLEKWMQHLEASNTQCSDLNHRTVAEIFRELYNQGRNNNIDILNDLLEAAKIVKFLNEQPKITKKQSQRAKNVFNLIHESLIAHIATYLNTTELFAIFDRICKKSFEIGMKPQSIQHWFINENNRYIEFDKILRMTKFDIYPLLCQVKQIRYRLYVEPQLILVSKSLKMIDTNTTVTNNHVIEVADKVETFKCSWTWPSSKGRQDSARQILNWIKNNLSRMKKLKHLYLKRFEGISNGVIKTKHGLKHPKANQSNHHPIIENERRLLDLLEIILPLSKKDKEIQNEMFGIKRQQFLKTNVYLDEKSKHVYHNVQSCMMTPLIDEIYVEKIRKDVINKIESKFNDIDANKLTYGQDKEQNSLEMLYFDRCDEYNFTFDHLTKETLIFIENCINYNSRIMKTLPNLRGFGFDHEVYRDMEHICVKDDLILLIAICILNSIGNQLTSLHITDNGYWNEFDSSTNSVLKFYSGINSTEYQKDKSIFNKYKNDCWYFANVEELCLQMLDHWYYDLGTLVNEYTFPKLKHLKCSLQYDNVGLECVEKYYCELKHLLKNCSKLQSLHLVVSRINCDDCLNLNSDSNKKDNPMNLFVNSIREALKGKQGKPEKNKTFIVKLEMIGDISKGIDNIDQLEETCRLYRESEEWINSGVIANHLLNLFEQLSIIYHNAMFCFRLQCNIPMLVSTVESHKKIIMSVKEGLKRILQKMTNMIDTRKSMSNFRIASYVGSHRWIVPFEIVLTNNNTQACWTEPKFKYQCKHCKTIQWLG